MQISSVMQILLLFSDQILGGKQTAPGGAPFGRKPEYKCKEIFQILNRNSSCTFLVYHPETLRYNSKWDLFIWCKNVVKNVGN